MSQRQRWIWSMKVYLKVLPVEILESSHYQRLSDSSPPLQPIEGFYSSPLVGKGVGRDICWCVHGQLKKFYPPSKKGRAIFVMVLITYCLWSGKHPVVPAVSPLVLWYMSTSHVFGTNPSPSGVGTDDFFPASFTRREQYMNETVWNSVVQAWIWSERGSSLNCLD